MKLVFEITKTLAVSESIFANGGITTSAGGALPGGLEVAGTFKGATLTASGSATFVGIAFASHTHAGVSTGSGIRGTIA